VGYVRQQRHVTKVHVSLIHDQGEVEHV